MADITPDAPTLDDVIRNYVLSVCEACGWSKTQAAVVLNVSVKTVYNHLDRYEKAGFIVKQSKAVGYDRKDTVTT